MRRRLSCALLVTAVAMLGGFSASALASSTHARAGGAGNAPPAKGKPIRHVYTSTYTDEKFGAVTCHGVHIISPEYPGTATTGGADKFKCKSTPKKALLFGKAGEKLPE